MFDETHARIAQTMAIHIARGAIRVQSAEEDAEAGIVSDSMMTSERELNRVEAVNLFVGRPFHAVVAPKNRRFRRPEKGVLHFFTGSKQTSWTGMMGNSGSAALFTATIGVCRRSA